MADYSIIDSAAKIGDSHIVKKVLYTLKDETDLLKRMLSHVGEDGMTFLDDAARLGHKTFINDVYSQLKENFSNQFIYSTQLFSTTNKIKYQYLITLKNINYIIQSSLISSRDIYEYLERYVDVILHIHDQGLDDIELIIDHLSLDYLNINQDLSQYFYAVSTFDGDRILANVSELFSTYQKIDWPTTFSLWGHRARRTLNYKWSIYRSKLALVKKAFASTKKSLSEDDSNKPNSSEPKNK
ncbi:MAG: hypothetical protein ACON5A_05720 [Candidatus Comchoanobacterales bacterium]